MHLKIPPPLVAVICAILMWAFARALPQFSFTFSVQDFAAIVLGIIGAAFAGVAITGFGAAKTTVSPLKPEKASTLVTNGIYDLTRNPMYLGLAIMLAGLAVKIGNPSNILLIAGFVMYINEFQIKPEENALRQKFGAAFEEYCRQTRRWI